MFIQPNLSDELAAIGATELHNSYGLAFNTVLYEHSNHLVLCVTRGGHMLRLLHAMHADDTWVTEWASFMIVALMERLPTPFVAALEARFLVSHFGTPCQVFVAFETLRQANALVPVDEPRAASSTTSLWVKLDAAVTKRTIETAGHRCSQWRDELHVRERLFCPEKLLDDEQSDVFAATPTDEHLQPPVFDPDTYPALQFSTDALNADIDELFW